MPAPTPRTLNPTTSPSTSRSASTTARDKFVRLHSRHQPLFHLWTQLQVERPSRHDENPAETAAAHDFRQEGLANRA